jgi:Amt family ammonium transporter
MFALNTLNRALPVAIIAPLALSVMRGEAKAEVSSETAYILNTFSFLIYGDLVMFMVAGFSVLESGLVRSKNTATICLKNIALYSIAGIVFFLVGYDLMYTGVDKGYIGTLFFLYNPGDAELTLLAAEEATTEQIKAVTDTAYLVSSDWFFQMVCCYSSFCCFGNSCGADQSMAFLEVHLLF